MLKPSERYKAQRAATAAPKPKPKAATAYRNARLESAKKKKRVPLGQLPTQSLDDAPRLEDPVLKKPGSKAVGKAAKPAGSGAKTVEALAVVEKALETA